jgi:MFS family permease
MTALRRYLRSFSGFERDARIFLLATAVYGIALSLWWVDFYLYVISLGFDAAFVGLVGAAISAAGVVVAFPASLLSNRIGRRRVMTAATAVASLAILLLLLVPTAPAVLIGAFFVGAANQAFGVMQAPFLMDHSRPEHRSELFSLQNAVGTAINAVAALVGGGLAALVAGIAGFAPDGPSAYRVLLVVMLVASVLATLTLFTLGDDHPRRTRPGIAVGRPADATGGSPGDVRDVRGVFAPRLALPHLADPGTFVRLLVPGFLISLGAGQVIPFLNIFVHGKFGLNLAELNAVFAVTSLGTTLAILLQPALASRVGKIGSVVIVQAGSIPFLVVLGFSPILWTVIVAMAIRNSLMNAGNPIFSAFAMEALPPTDRAIYAAASNLEWSLGWVIAGPWFSLLQQSLGFEAGFTVNFLCIIGLYSAGTFLTWRWFHAREQRGSAPAAATPVP